MEDENIILRRLLWMNHGHEFSALYGDDGEMQCNKCMCEFGFWDWKRTPAHEIEAKIQARNMRRVSIKQSGEFGKRERSPCGEGSNNSSTESA